jgi:hypothetical protein
MNGLVTPSLVFVKNTIYPERPTTTSGRIGVQQREGVAGLYDQSREPRTIKYKVTQETEETIIIDLRLKRFGCNRIRFRLKRLGVSLSSRTIYKMLSRHGLNILKCKIKNRKYKRFAMKHPNDMMYRWISYDRSICTAQTKETITS